MKLWKVWSVFGVGTASLVAALAYQTVGCSSGSSDAGAVGLPPAPPPNPTPATANVETFAIQKLLLGEADRAGTPSITAWKSYGYNLDGKVTTKDSTDVCTLHTGAPKSNQADGNNGIDNAFGSVILPIIETAASMPTPSTNISGDIQKGDFTIQIQVTGLDDANAAQNATGLKGQLFASGAYGGASPPAFDSTTDWPVSGLLLNNPNDISQGSKIAFNQAYVTNGTFVSGDLTTGGIQVSISLVFQGVALTLSVNHAVITFDHKTANGASNGTIAGVIDTDQLITGLQSVASRISQSFCNPSTFNGIADQLRQASDIIKDGTNTAGAQCDGISVGLGFEAVKVANPTKIASSDGAAPPDPCSTDGGSDASSGGDAASDATTD